MNNSIAILQINPSENLALILQENPNGRMEWHFTRGSGSNGLGTFNYVATPAPHINCYDNRSQVVMILYGVPSRPQGAFPFLMADQPPNNVSGELDVMGENMPLQVSTYNWSVQQVVPSAIIQTAR